MYRTDNPSEKRARFAQKDKRDKGCSGFRCHRYLFSEYRANVSPSEKFRRCLPRIKNAKYVPAKHMTRGTTVQHNILISLYIRVMRRRQKFEIVFSTVSPRAPSVRTERFNNVVDLRNCCGYYSLGSS